MAFNLTGLFNLAPAIKAACARFPFSISVSLLGLSVSWLQIHRVIDFDSQQSKIFYSFIFFATVALASFKLWVESEDWPVKKYMAGSVLLLPLIYFYTVALLNTTEFAALSFVLLAVLLSLLFSPYLRRKSNNDSVWFFNYQTAVAVFYATLAAIVLGGGLSLILASTEYLFEAKIPGKIYSDVWLLAWMGLFPVYVLANISKEFDFDESSCHFPKGISFIANYILVPLMFVYLAILYAYFFKIIIQWELPKGNLGWMISGFGATGIVTKLLMYPVVNKGTRLLRWFERYFYYALIVPLMVLFVAIGMRISDYGVTEHRYGVVMLGLWFAIVSLSVIVLKDRFHIKYIPMLLAVLAFVSAYGPWSAASVSLNSQLKRFDYLLEKNSLLLNGQVIKSAHEVGFDDRKSMSSVADYLTANEWRSKKLKSRLIQLFERGDNEKLSVTKILSADDVMAMLNVDYVNRWQRRNEEEPAYFTYNRTASFNDLLLDVSGYEFAAQNGFHLYNNRKAKHVFKVPAKAGLKTMTVNIDEKIFSVNLNNDERFEFDLEKLVLKLRQQGIKDANGENAGYLTFKQTSESGRYKISLYIKQLDGRFSSKTSCIFNNIQYLLMLGHG
ncbi:MAG: DUF4153 domain-containing protein [Gammaproteobacteria bacterium]|nr:DUF4153 domain-containing protein [Gammaproteobacteria bacterium]